MLRKSLLLTCFVVIVLGVVAVPFPEGAIAIFLVPVLSATQWSILRSTIIIVVIGLALTYLGVGAMLLFLVTGLIHTIKNRLRNSFPQTSKTVSRTTSVAGFHTSRTMNKC